LVYLIQLGTVLIVESALDKPVHRGDVLEIRLKTGTVKLIILLIGILSGDAVAAFLRDHA
jgi:hypothetical protein